MSKSEEKIIYYFSVRFPYYGIKEFKVDDELYLQGKTSEPSIQYLVTMYDLNFETYGDDYSRWISVYRDYDDDDILHHEDSFPSSSYVMSYNKEKITKLYKDAILNKERELLKNLEKINEAKEAFKDEE